MSRKSEIRNQKSEARSLTDSPHRPVVLFAVTGMSPAIITETVWALAHEKPRLIPDRVVVVTTTAGRDAVRRELFDDGVWEQFRAALVTSRLPLASKLRFGTTPADIHVFTRADPRGRSVELDDIRTQADNAAAADFLLEALRPFTENPDVRLVCSLAGGRKTMGALLYACLSLIGRDDDRLTHVLVNEPFDDPRLQPRFYFPTDGAHRAPLQGKPVSGRNARIGLADVPFVPLRQLFPKELGRLPGSFSNLVRQYRRTVAQLSAPPGVQFGTEEPEVRVDSLLVRLPVTAFALLEFLAERALQGDQPFPSFRDMLDPFKAFLGNWGAGRDAFDFRNADSIKNLARTATEDNLRKLALTIKEKLIAASVAPGAVQHLVPHRGYAGVRVRKL